MENKEISFHSHYNKVGISPGCYVCGGKPSVRQTLMIMVLSQEDGLEMIDMFPKTVCFYEKKSESGHIQIIIGACNKHQKEINNLSKLIKDKKISRKKIKESIKK